MTIANHEPLPFIVPFISGRSVRYSKITAGLMDMKKCIHSISVTIDKIKDLHSPIIIAGITLIRRYLERGELNYKLSEEVILYSKSK